MTESEPIDIDFEEVETKKKGLKSLFKAVSSSLKENLRGRVLNKELEVQEKNLENNMLEIILDIAKSSHLTNEEAQDIIGSDRFKSLEKNNQKKLIKALEKRGHANQAETKRQEEEGEHLQKEAENIEHRKEIARQIRETRDKMIANIDECLQRAEHSLINDHYEDAITQAEEGKEQIIYKQKKISAIKSLLNNTIFRIKRTGEIGANKSNMTTRLLPDGIDIILKEREKIANAIIGEARAKLKKETKEKKEQLAHPKEVTKELEGGRTPIYQGRLIVSFEKGVRRLPVTQSIIRTENNIKNTFFIVQEQRGEHLFGILDDKGEPVITELMRKGFRIVKNDIFYKTVSHEKEKGVNLITRQPI